MAMVPLADRTRAALQRSEGALRNLPVMGGVEENALVVFVAAAPTDVGCNTHHGKHLADARDDALDRHILAHFLRIHLSDRSLISITVLIRRKHDIVAPSQFLLDLP